MANPFLGEIRIFPFDFAPVDWAFCDGQILSIEQFTALFALIGTFYGGDGVKTFALPDLRSRVPVDMGQGSGLSLYELGQVGGVENVTLNISEIPAHNHPAGANSAPGTSSRPAGNVPARTKSSAYGAAPDGTTMNAGMIGDAGGSEPHTNIQPYLALNFCIALAGIFPSRE